MDLQLEPSSSKTIPMMTFDGVLFQVDEEIAKKMEALRSFMEINHDSGKFNMIPLPSVSSNSLTKIIDYIKTYMEKYTKVTVEARAYNREYLEKLDNNAIKELLLAVDYLNVKELLDLLNREIADRIKNKSVEYVRKFFRINNDYTPEEEQAIRQEYPWAWEDIDED